MAIEIKRKSEEPISSFLYRFNRLLQQSGVLNDAKKTRFHRKKLNRRQKRTSAIYRASVRRKIQQMKKAGLLKGAEDIKFIKKLLRNPKSSLNL